MKITIDERVRQAAPGLALGIVSAGVHVRAEDAELRSELEGTAARHLQELTDIDLAQLPQIQGLRRLYRGLGKDPTRYRGSSEALLRRIVHGKGLCFINSAVDVCNLVSIETRHSLGAYDIDRIQGDVVFRPGAAGEVYEGIGRGAINLEGLPVFCDAAGPFGTPTSDSERTKITLQTKRVGFVIICCSSREKLEQQLKWTGELLTRYSEAGEVQTSVVE
jgi:DNA/RNA-binding domain of Phe-tRNA-synthetase-like protein